MTISQRLMVLILVGVASLISLGGVGFIQLNRIYTELENIEDNVVPSIELLADLDSSMQEQRNALLGHILSTEPAQMSEQEAAFNQQHQEIMADLDKYAPLIADSDDRAHYDKVKAGIAELDRLYAPILTASRANQNEQAHQMAKASSDVFKRVHKEVTEHVAYNHELGVRSKKQAMDVNQQAKLISVAVAVLASALLAVVGLLTYRQVVGSVKSAQRSIEHLAESLDFTTRCDSSGSDEIAQMLQSFNKLIARMQDSLRTMINASHDVSQSATELAGSAQQVAHGSSAQSESASTMAAALEQITVSINHVADRAHEANSLAQDTGTRAHAGEVVIGDTTQSIESIAGAVGSAASEMGQLVERTREIATVVSVIKDVADQTNLLALNAAIEAARAGETGRGFAVVADEVRKLAERTALSTQEIAQIINAIQTVSGSAAERMQGAVHNVEEGVSEAEKARTTILSISEVAGQSRQLVGEISNAIREQGVAANSIAQQVETVAQMAEENSAAAGHATDLAKRLQELSRVMEKEVAAYRV